MVSNIYLNNLGKYLNNYQGTFSCDNIKKNNLNMDNATYIINLSKLTEKGSHLIAIQTNSKNKKVVYFDSFGLPCSNKDILTFIYDINNKYEYNSHQVQHLDSNYCGIYCLAFVMYFEKNNSLKNFIKMFNSYNLLENDKIVVNYISNNVKIFKNK